MKQLPVAFGVTLFMALALVGVAELSAQTTHDVQMIGASFSPANITIQQGDIIKWTNNSGLFHTSTSGAGCVADGLWTSVLLPPLATFQFTFNNAGAFPYYCIPHCLIGMVGAVTVQAAPADCVLNCPAADGGVIAAGAGPSNKSPDLDGDGQVALVDVSIFAAAFPPNAYEFCIDYDCDGVIGLVDLSIFAQHFAHAGGQLGVCQ